MKGKTSTGFEWEVDDSVTDDWEIVELLLEADSGKLNSLVKAMKRILGNDGYDALKEHIRDDNGKVSATRVKNEFLEFMQTAPKLKN